MVYCLCQIGLLSPYGKAMLEMRGSAKYWRLVVVVEKHHQGVKTHGELLHVGLIKEGELVQLDLDSVSLVPDNV